MIETPPHFTPLTTARDSEQPLTLICQGSSLLVDRATGQLPAHELLHDLIGVSQTYPVGMLGEQYVQCVGLPTDATHLTLPESLELRSMRQLWDVLDWGLLGVVSRACQIAEWARTHRFCGACGHPTQAIADERCMRCPQCGHQAYPRISPAMMVLVRRGESILLARHSASPMARYTALAGFVEAGESIEQAVHREVFEEVGLRVHNLRYFSSQSWPFPHSLMIAYTADYLSGDIQVDGKEIFDARWFGPGDPLPDLAPPVSIASALIRAHLPRQT